ncbi:MAG: hypothetical protein U0133_14705 [Gemmatimonadales bacterium]
MSDEPEYLKALRQNQERQKQAAPKQSASGPSKPPTPAERETLRWAKEVGGKDIRVGSLSGAKVAILVQPITPFGKPPVALEGLSSREALAERVKAAQGAGENVVGTYELTTGRPLTWEIQDGKVVFTAGQARQIMKAESPERMIRLAAKQAEILAKTRKVDDRDNRGGGGGRGQGGGGGGRGR